MRRGLTIYAVLVLLVMLAVTSWASLHESVLPAAARMGHDPWTVATLFDTYFGFLWFWLWIAFTERGIASKTLWLLAILALGNLAMAAFVLLRLHRTRGEVGGEGYLRSFLMGAR
jgi:hypothetical protein